MNRRVRAMAVLLAVIALVSASFATPVAALERAAITAAAKHDDHDLGAGFYGTERGKLLMRQAQADGNLGNPATNYGGMWMPGNVAPGMEQRHARTLARAWGVGEQRHVKIGLTRVADLTRNDPALLAELREHMNLDPDGYYFHAIGGNSPRGKRGGDRALHTELLLLTAMALNEYVTAAERADVDENTIVSSWRTFVGKLPRGPRAYGKALAGGFTIGKVHVGELQLPPGSLSEKQPCGGVGGGGCTPAAKKNTSYGTGYHGEVEVGVAATQVGEYRAETILDDLNAALAAGNGNRAATAMTALSKTVGFIAKKAGQEVKNAKVDSGREEIVRRAGKMLERRVSSLYAMGRTKYGDQVYLDLAKLDPKAPSAADLRKDAQKTKKKTDDTVGEPFHTHVCEEGGALGGRAAHPVIADVGALPAAPVGCPGRAPAPSGLRRSLETAAAGGNGGIDFSSMQLRYLADKPTGDGVSSIRYAFSGDDATGYDDQHVAAGARDARQASDAFFVWLPLPRSSFWVNLSPDEPDRIIDPAMGRTDAGRVMLQADLKLKDAGTALLDPRSRLGKEFWDGLRGRCFSFRSWIVPGRASVYDGGDELYIDKAPLKVMMATDYLKSKGVNGTGGCRKPKDAAADEHNEELYRHLILPKVEKRVNTGKEFAELRRVYRSRVAAEWYRRRSATHATAYKPLIDGGDISRWRYHGSWTPLDTFHAYVKEFMKHKVTIKTHRGGWIYKQTFTFGGVDWTHMAYRSMSRPDFRAGDPGLAADVRRALTGPSSGDGGMLIGGAVPVRHADAGERRSANLPAILGLAAAVPVVLVAGGVGLGIGLGRRRSRRPAR